MDEDRYYNLGSHDKLFNQIDELTDALASRDAEIESLRQQLNQLRNLLRPFAALLQDHNIKGPDAQPIFQINNAKITRGDLRRALATTEPKP